MPEVIHLDPTQFPTLQPYTLVECDPGASGTRSTVHSVGVTHRLNPAELWVHLPQFLERARVHGHRAVYVRGANVSG